ncbi:MAG: acetyl-CoA carboxylase biotin carboxylase subunit [Dehalococcoidia bacterium]|nr:acetyl-CoA carboxylase biotin carboxylase subunit [Dehalococcoidia bacterium]
MFRRILIANRGEIAVRIIRSCNKMGVYSIVPYSTADKDALFVGYANEAHYIGGSDPRDSYLNIEKIIKLAQETGAEAIHPGYGFLSENSTFSEACTSAGITFIGPSIEAMQNVKPKHKARDMVAKVGIPIAPGSSKALSNPDDNPDEAFNLAEKTGYPVIVKPSDAGGGIGMIVAHNKDELQEAIKYAKARGKASFGMDEVYIEKYIPQVKHIEIQVLADNYGNVIHLGERECSVQRRYQKLIEEAPSPAITPEMRTKLGKMAATIAKTIKSTNCMTVEFIYSMDTGEVYFNECNARLQVEHSVTELVTNTDIVREQLKIAAGERLSYSQDDIQIYGHAIECRINAEDPLRNFMPSPKKITKYQPPKGVGIRVDSGAYAGYTMPFYYDSLIAKLLTWDRNRADAISRMKNALGDFIIEGVETNLPLHLVAMEDELFQDGKYTTLFLTERDIVAKLQQSTDENSPII